MPEYTEEQVEEILQEAVAKTEKSFGGTFKRLKSENEDLKNRYEAAVAENETDKKEMEQRIADLESLVSGSTQHISKLAIQGELQKQLREKGPFPERFVDVDSIEYSEDPETFRDNVTMAVEKGRSEFEQVLRDVGIDVPQNIQSSVNPTNPPSRDTKTAHALKKSASKEVLQDMMRRGLIR